MITSEQFQEWKIHPVTKEIFAELTKVRSSIIEQLSYGNTIGPDAQATHGFTNRAVGQIDGLNQLLNISFSEIETTSTDDSSVGGY